MPQSHRFSARITVVIAGGPADVLDIQKEVHDFEQIHRAQTAHKAAKVKAPAAPKPPRSVVPQPIKHEWRPSQPVAPGPWAVRQARLVPSNFRKSLQNAVCDMVVHVGVK